MKLFHIIKERATHGGRLERWLGKAEVDRMSKSMENWYGGPIAVAGVPGNVWAHKGGDFRGPIRSGQFICVKEFVKMRAKRVIQSFGQRQRQQLNTGFASLDAIIASATTGKSRYFPFNKTAGLGVANGASSLWRVVTSPPAGVAPGNAPGGTAFDDSSVGAFPFSNPTGGDTQHFVKADYSISVVNEPFLLYDLIFGCNKTMNDATNEAVTGVPTRYQSSTATDMDYAGGNFLFIQVGGTSLAAGAHNWGVAGSSNECLYRNQAGTDNQIMPVLAGVSGSAADKLDQTAGPWFAPLATGDTGIKDLAQMRCSAAIATGVIWFMIGHPIAFFPGVPVANAMLSIDGIMTAFNLVRIFDDAALAFLRVMASGATTPIIGGSFQTVSG